MTQAINPPPVLTDFESALERYSHLASPAHHLDLSEIVSPALFHGSSDIFDDICSHARSMRDGELHSAFLRFMDQFCGSGSIMGADGSVASEWRSAALLVEVFFDEDGDDPRLIWGLEQLSESIGALFRIAPERVSVAPVLLDLRSAQANFQMFRFAMLPTQLAGIDLDALKAANPTTKGAPERFPSWRALSFSCAFEPGQAPESLLPRLLSSMEKGPAHFVGRYDMHGEERSAIFSILAVSGAFSSCSKKFEHERLSLSSDVAALSKAFGPHASGLSAILEPQIAPGLESVFGLARAPFSCFALSITHPDGSLLDAMELPADPEVLELTHATLDQAGILLSISAPVETSFNHSGERLWATPTTRLPFDVFTWRRRVLGVIDPELDSRDNRSESAMARPASSNPTS